MNMLRNPPCTDRKAFTYRLVRQTLQAKKTALEARLVALKTECRFFTEHPKRIQQAEALMFAEGVSNDENGDAAQNEGGHDLNELDELVQNDEDGGGHDLSGNSDGDAE
jgi:hypothetical protein